MWTTEHSAQKLQDVTDPPSLRRLRHIPFQRIALPAVVVVTLALGFAEVLHVERLQAVHEGLTEREIRLEHLELDVTRANALEWETVAEGRLEPEVAAELRRIDARIRGAFASLGRGGTDAAAVVSAQQLYDRYRAAVMREGILITDGRVAAARRLDEQTVDPAYRELARGLKQLTTDTVAAEREAGRAYHDAFIAAVIGGLAVLLGLAAWTSRVRRDRARARAEERATRQSEARLRALLRDATDAVLVVDPDARVRLDTGAGARVLQADAKGLAGARLDTLVHPDDAEGLRAFIRAAAGGEAVAGPVEWCLPDGERRVEALANPLLDDETDDVVVTIRDVTERVRALEEHKRLEARLHERQRLESIGQLAGGVAHDFNNVLAVIGTCADFALDDLEPDAPVRADVEEIRRAADRAAELTRRLLVFSRREVTKPKVLDLTAAVERTRQLLVRTLGEDVRVDWRPGPEISVEIDPHQLEHVLVNLALNARDAMPGGGRLQIDTDEVVLDAAATAGSQLGPGRYGRLRVRDDGEGMPEEVRHRAFEPFYTTKPQGAGTGLGLATVYGIARDAGGAVELHSVPGRGTTVEIFLPLTARTRPARPEDAAGPAPAADARRILLAEDEESVRRLVRRILSGHGYDVLEAGDAHEALARVDDPAAIDLLLTDVVMPGASGKDLADRLRAERPDLPVVFMSGYTDDVVVRHGVRDNAVALLDKPFDADGLLRAVGEALEGATDGDGDGRG